MPRTDQATASLLSETIVTCMAEAMEDEEQNMDTALISIGLACKQKPEILFSQVLKQAEDRLLQQKFTAQKSLHHAILTSIKATMEEKSCITSAHGERLVSLTRLLGQSIQLEDGQLQELELLAHVHDIGKIIISDTIINKPGKLSAAEWQEMKRHPEIGFRIAQASPDIKHIAFSILHHHERWDAKGYPCGLKGEEIPVLSRILAIVDAYDAMTNERPYRKAMRHEEALQEISNCAGTQFDPLLAKLFIRFMC